MSPDVNGCPSVQGSRELLWILRLTCVHPCKWKNDHFVVPGPISVCILCALSIYCAVIAITAFQNPSFGLALINDENNPIRSEMNSLVSILGCAAFFLTSLKVLSFIGNRSRMALTFNELNIFSNSCVNLGCLQSSAISLGSDQTLPIHAHGIFASRLGRPRQKLAFAAFLYVPWYLAIVINRIMKFGSLPMLQAPHSTWYLVWIVSSSLCYHLVLSLQLTMSTLMIFVYGTLYDCLVTLLDPLGNSSRRENFDHSFLEVSFILYS